MTDESSATPLALVHQGWNQLRAQQPLAAWSSWQLALRLQPEDPAATQALGLLEAALDLPAVARTSHRLRSTSDPARRHRWDAAFQEAGEGLTDPARAALVFARLAASDPHDADARYNLGLCLAWTGRNLLAIEALDSFLRLEAESNPAASADAWTLAELLRQGAGAESVADALDCRFVLVSERDPEELLQWLQNHPHVRACPVPPTGLLPNSGPAPRVFEWLDRPLPTSKTDLTAAELPRLRALVMLESGQLRFSSPDPASLRDLQEEVEVGFPDEIGPTEARPLPIPLIDLAAANVRVPADIDPEARPRLTREAIEDYFENHWIHQPRHGLAGLQADLSEQIPLSPARASRLVSSNPVARAKLEGIVRFQEQLAERPRSAALYQGYPFDRLRRRLGLEPMAPDTLDTADLSCAPVRELESIDLSALEGRPLVEAWRSAHGLDPDGPVEHRILQAIIDRDPLLALLDESLALALVEDAPATSEALQRLDQLDAAAQSVSNRLSPSFLRSTRASLLCLRAQEVGDAASYRQAALAQQKLLEEFPADPSIRLRVVLDVHQMLEAQPVLAAALYRQAIEIADPAHDLLVSLFARRRLAALD